MHPRFGILSQIEFKNGTGVDPIYTQKPLADLESALENAKFS
jgi:hypothetical protein